MIIRHDVDDRAYRELGRAYPAVCCLNAPQPAKGAGVLIDSRFVLTAAHGAAKLQAGYEILVAGLPFPIRRIVLHPSWQHRRAKVGASDTAILVDLALVELERPVDSIQPLPLYLGRAEEGIVVTLIGKGAFGTGLTGPEMQDGLWRGATNRVDKVLHNAWLVLRFDEPGRATDLEGVEGPGDSGGPALIDEGGRVQVAGIASWEDRSGAAGRGQYGVQKHYVRVSAFGQWIEEAIAR